MNTEKILVRLPNWVGDSIMCEPAIRRLREIFPEAGLIFVAPRAVANLFSNTQPGDEIWLLNKDLTNHKFRDLVKSAGIKRAVLFTNSFSSAWRFKRAGASEIWGYSRDFRGWLLDRPIKPVPSLNKLHQVFYYLQLVEQMSGQSAPLPDSSTPIPTPKFEPTPDELVWVEEYLQTHSLVPEERQLVAITPGAQNSRAKMWSPESYAKVASWLIRERNCQVIMLGGPDEIELGKSIAELAHPGLVDGMGKTDLRQMTGLLSRCKVLLTNDNGAMHLGAALGIWTAAIFGPTVMASTGPVGDKTVVIHEPVHCSPCELKDCPIDHRCMSRITPERVQAELSDLLEV